MCKKFGIIRQAKKESRSVTVQFPFGTVRGRVTEINEPLKKATIQDASGREHIFMGDDGARRVEVWLTPLPA